jgi:hypothetical protein
LPHNESSALLHASNLTAPLYSGAVKANVSVSANTTSVVGTTPTLSGRDAYIDA